MNIRSIAALFSTFGLWFLLGVAEAMGGGVYVCQIATPISVGTACAANITNNFDPSAVVTQPAGLADAPESIRVGAQLVAPIMRFDSSFAEAGGSDGGNAGLPAVVPGLYVSKKVTDKLGFGFGVSGTAGGGLDYGSDFVGRYGANRSVLQVVGMAGGLGYRINDQFAIGASVFALYSLLDIDVSVRQPGAPDGQVSMNKLTDLSPQGLLGLTWKPDDRTLFGLSYLTHSRTKPDGDLDFKGIRNPVANEVTGRLDSIEVDYDYPQAVTAGLRFQYSPELSLMMSADWQDWSAFGSQVVTINSSGPLTIVQSSDRNWKDTWHLGAAFAHKRGERVLSAGIGYDSSPVTDSNRTIDLPMDQQLQFSLAYGKRNKNRDYSIGLDLTWFGRAKVDQEAQDVRFKGDFSTNIGIFLQASYEHRF